MKSWLFFLCALIVPAMLYGCMSEPVANACPALHAWTKGEQLELAAELRLHRENSMIYRSLEDYKRMRDDARACGSK